MCGFAGVVSPDRPARAALVEALLDTLKHRGPDDSGVWAEGPAALGVRRLAVIDLAGGHQPLSDETGRYWIAYNGEVYNFRELRDRMEREGARFRTESDTEVVVQWFARRGVDGLRDLNGMFAFAVWDREERSLWIVRDRCGKKPAYYAQVNGGLVFASELRAVATHPQVPRDLDRAALSKYFAYDYVPSPMTALRHVRKLTPGSFLLWRNGRVETQVYWTLPDPSVAEGDLEERIRETLARSVRRRLVSDVPLGVLLSGGVDSSVVSALASRDGARLRSFSVGFDDPSFDESPHARRVAEHLGTDHTQERLTMAEAVAATPGVLSGMDDLLADSSLIPTYLVSKSARRHVTVVLSGDGGDELFAGYPTFFAHRVAARLSKIPRFFWRAAHAAAAAIPVSGEYMGLDVVARRFCRGLSLPPAWRNQAWLGAFGPAEIATFLPGAAAAEEIYSEVSALSCRGDAIDRALAETFRFYLSEGVLTKVDRASMMVSLEVRSPFLDDEMIDLAWSIPWRLKMRGREGKVILKRAFAGLLPGEILHRRKQGFAVPLAGWLCGGLRPLVEEYLFRDGLDPSPVRKWWDLHRTGARNLARELWSILVYQVWRESVRRWEPLRLEVG